MIEIDSRSPVPTYAQIIQQIRALISNGSMAKGDSLPAIRQLAVDLEINPATVAKAYQILEREGLILTAGRRGTFVHDQAVPNMKENSLKEVQAQIQDLVAHWRGRGMALRDLKEIFQKAISSVNPKESQ